MEDDHSHTDTFLQVSGPLAPSRCAVCSQKSRLLRCAGCKVVEYCGTAHQVAHRSKHKRSCNTIKNTRETLQREQAALECQPGQQDVFCTSVGNFWGLVETRDYMRARFAAANALLEIDTKRAVESAVEHFMDMIRLCRSDNLGVRDIIPHLLLRLGREQECYNFLKWWATAGEAHVPPTQYSSIPAADPFESIAIFSSGPTSLAHIVALTLLKLRFYLDMDAYSTRLLDYGIWNRLDALSIEDIDRPLGRFVVGRMKTMSPDDIHQTVNTLKGQYQSLCRQVHDANHYFWEALVDGETPSAPPYYSSGSKEEADLVLHQCRSAWDESEDAILMVGTDTSVFTTVYQGPATPAGLTPTVPGAPGNGPQQISDKPRGTGVAFPSRLQLATPPSQLFVPTVVMRNETVRFVHRNDQRKVLVFTDGACASNGQANPRGGWAVVVGAATSYDVAKSDTTVSGRLENKGPFGDYSVATSNRAELRAVIAALRLCDWRAEGFDNLVIAADASYVVDGATGWAKTWVRKGWKTKTGNDVKNKDLWELLLGEVEKWQERGVQVDLWKIPRELNQEADEAAKYISHNGGEVVEFRDFMLDPRQHRGTARKSSPVILALCLQCESLFDDIFGGLVSRITSKAKMERARTPETALARLAQESRPSVILVTDGALTRERKVWERVIDHLREGATVILAGLFSNFVNEGNFNRFFAKIGLPWKRGSYHRATVNLRYSVLGDDLASKLPAAYSQKSLFVQNVERSAVWYCENNTSEEAAVVFAKVGQGMLGYIGDVNGEEGSEQVVLAMCGLLE